MFLKTEKLLVIPLIGLLAGCDRHHPQLTTTRASNSASTGPLISAGQAETIARREAANRRLTSFDLENNGLFRETYWRVIAKADANGAHTNILPVVLSRDQARAIAREDAKSAFGASPFTLGTPELLQGSYWHITVRQQPPVPGGFFVLVISAKDGTVLTSTPGM